MASRSEIARQDQASEQRRREACETLITRTEIPEDAGLGTTRGIAVGVLSALIEAIDAEAADVEALRRKGWQSAQKTLIASAIVVRGWRDLLIEYTPPKTIEVPIVPTSALPDARGRDLEQRLVDTFGPELAPTRHIRTVIEPADSDPARSPHAPAYGPLCGATTGSFTHPGGANCETCHALYAEHNGGEPYAGPVAHGNTVPAAPTVERRDEPITPAVAAEIREEIEAAKERAEATAATLLGHPVTIEPCMPNDVVAIVSPEDLAVIVGPFEQLRREAVKNFGEALDARVADEAAKGIDAGGATLAEFVLPNIVEPPARRAVRERMTVAQVREHGLGRQRGLHHRSVSQVTGFADCGTRAALSDLEIPAWWNVGGSAFHACAEEINCYAVASGDVIAGPSGPESLWLAHFEAEIEAQKAATPEHHPDTWRAANKGSEHYDWWRVEGPEMVRKYVTWLSDRLTSGWSIATAYPADGTPVKVPVIEFETQLDVGLQVPNLSIIDLALTRPSLQPHTLDQVLLVDLKAGGSAPKDTFQLGVYGWALLAAGVAVHPSQVRAAYYRARRGELLPGVDGWPVLDMHPWPDIVQRYRDMDTIERQGIYLPNVTNFCGGCGVRDLCPAQATRT